MLISAISHSLGIHSAGFLAEEVDSVDKNDDSTQLNRELRTQVSDTSKSAS